MKYPHPESEFRKQLEALIARAELLETTILTPDEWKSRGETKFDEALIHLTTSDHLFASGHYESELQVLCAAAGWEFEQGYMWSFHFWP